MEIGYLWEGKRDLPEAPHEPLQYFAGGRVHQPGTEKSQERVYVLIEVRVELWCLECAIERAGCVGEQGVFEIDGAERRIGANMDGFRRERGGEGTEVDECGGGEGVYRVEVVEVGVSAGEEIRLGPPLFRPVPQQGRVQRRRRRELVCERGRHERKYRACGCVYVQTNVWYDHHVRPSPARLRWRLCSVRVDNHRCTARRCVAGPDGLGVVSPVVCPSVRHTAMT